MAQWFRFRRTTRLVALSAIVVVGIFAVVIRGTASTQPTNLVRGNVPGEWRYWGGDAWSTRYSPLDQINASNFESLEQAWRWPAGAFGADEYYRTTPLYANGRLFTVASTQRSRSAAIARPTTRSDSPPLYASAVSMKLIPRSRAANASSASCSIARRSDEKERSSPRSRRCRLCPGPAAAPPRAPPRAPPPRARAYREGRGVSD